MLWRSRCQVREKRGVDRCSSYVTVARARWGRDGEGGTKQGRCVRIMWLEPAHLTRIQGTCSSPRWDLSLPQKPCWNSGQRAWSTEALRSDSGWHWALVTLSLGVSFNDFSYSCLFPPGMPWEMAPVGEGARY